MQRICTSCRGCLLPFFCLFFAIRGFSQTPISTVNAPFISEPNQRTYTATGAPGSPLAGNTYTYNYATNNPNNNRVLSNFTIAANTYIPYSVYGSFVRLKRKNNPLVTGQRSLVFQQGTLGGSVIDIRRTYQDNMEIVFLGFKGMNAGTDNLFANQGDGNGNNNNIERLDFVFPTGIRVSNLAEAGITVFERGVSGAHDPVKIAVITAVDINKNPTAYSSIVQVNTTDYGGDLIAATNYQILRKEEGEADLRLSTNTNQAVGGSFVRFNAFPAITTSTIIYGYSIIPNDFPGTPTDITNITSNTFYPNNTSGATGEGGIDLVAVTGVSQNGNYITVLDGDIDDDNDGLTDLEESGGINATGDDDGDGLLNYQDPSFCSLNGAGVCTNLDTDGDGLIDQLDLDSDSDGIPDIVEAGGTDTDGDGKIDGSQTADSDGDGLLDIYDPTTGGTALLNRDTDGDGKPNGKDLDADNDGIPDIIEAGGIDVNNNGQVDNPADADNDGMADVVDADQGNDGIVEAPNKAELKTGADISGDGRPDSYPEDNADNSGQPNPYDLDADGDGIFDSIEDGITDVNRDGIADGTDLDQNGWSDVVSALPTLPLRNSDGDAFPDYRDIDADNDGITDNIEGQSTAGYILPSAVDVDGDGLSAAYDLNDNLFAGPVNNGITPVDKDLDLTPDYLDTDTDNDGVLDIAEGHDYNLNGLPDDLVALQGTDADGDGLDDRFDLVTGPLVTNQGIGGAPTNGAVGPLQQTIPAATDRDWRNIGYALPVDFLGISAVLMEDKTLVRWQVENEVEVDRYEVERSIDNTKFSTIGTVLPVENGSNRKDYEFTDNTVLQTNTSKLYYRVKQVDKNTGVFKRSNTVIVQLIKLSGGMQLYPNPIAGAAQLAVQSDVATQGDIRITDVNGRVVSRQTIQIGKGVNVIALSNVSKLKAGAYFVQVMMTNGKTKIFKIIKN
jgi:Secretion system C-terminal sorting domain